MAGESQEESNDDGASAPEDSASSGSADAVADGAPEASAQAASTAAADGAAGGTTVKIAVYRSSYQLAWDLNDEHGVESLMATWANGTREAPDWWEAVQGSPGSQVECPPEYARDAEPKRTGYTFLGWSTDPAAPKGQMLDELAIPEDAEIAGEGDERTIALHAIWTPIEYSVVFDLAKNPEDASAVPSFAWTTGKGEFSDLGNGRYRLHGITLDDYDPATGLIEIATPSRGTGGYRFLSWAEPESQQDPAVAMRRSGTSKWFVNPVALPHYDYEPVLTARWGLSFDVDVPSQVTFDQYDSLEVEGSLTDSTSKEDVDEESPDAHDAGKQAHFCSQSTATDYRIVGLESVRAASADDVLTTSDSTKATHEEVLGSERLLSMFASADRSESAGVHFKLDDAVDMDSARYSSFVIPRQASGFDPAATDRDGESRLYVSYRLNLDNKVDGALEPNHGLVSAANVSDGVRTRIADVSYEFAVADHEIITGLHLPTATGSKSDPLYIEHEGKIYGLEDIKASADCIATYGKSSPCYNLYKSLLDAQVMTNGNPGPGPYFQLKIGNVYLPLQLIGICQDTKAAGGKAGLTFQVRDVYAYNRKTCSEAGSTSFVTYMNGTENNKGGWDGSSMRTVVQLEQFLPRIDPLVQEKIETVVKYHQLTKTETDPETGVQLQKSTDARAWLLSMHEVFGTGFNLFNASEGRTDIPGYTPFQYQAYEGNNGSINNPKAIKKFNGSVVRWWFRSAYMDDPYRFCFIEASGDREYGFAPGWNGVSYGVAPAFCL